MKAPALMTAIRFSSALPVAEEPQSRVSIRLQCPETQENSQRTAFVPTPLARLYETAKDEVAIGFMFPARRLHQLAKARVTLQSLLDTPADILSDTSLFRAFALRFQAFVIQRLNPARNISHLLTKAVQIEERYLIFGKDPYKPFIPPVTVEHPSPPSEAESDEASSPA